MNGYPPVTVLMSVFNSEDYLRKAIDSILNQTLVDFEFIVIEDGSTDRSWDILTSVEDSRMLLRKNTRNIGLTRSLNRGLEWAKGKYVVRMDADDISKPNRLSMQIRFLEQHPDVGVLGGAVQIIDEQDREGPIREYPVRDSLIRWHMCFEDPIAHPATAIRADVLRAIGGYDESLRSAQDYDLWRRLGTVTREANLKDVLIYLRRHKACITQTRHAEQIANSIEVSKAAIADILNEETPDQAVQCLWKRDFRHQTDIVAAADLISRLYVAYLRNYTLSVTEKRLVQRDAIKRILRLSRYARSFAVTGLLLSRAHRIHPLAAALVVPGWLYRCARRSL